MAKYRLSRKAEEDLLEIWSYIAESSPKSATKLIRAFHQPHEQRRIAQRALAPRLGQPTTLQLAKRLWVVLMLDSQ